MKSAGSISNDNGASFDATKGAALGGAQGANGSHATLTFLGAGTACGVPMYFCGCEACKEASRNPRAQRSCSSIAIINSQTTLIDCAPELRQQLQREGISSVDRILFTHEHFDHVGGIPGLEYMVRLKTKTPVDFYCNEPTEAFIEVHFDHVADTFAIHRAQLGATLAFDGISYTPISANHVAESFGYLIEVPPAISSSGKLTKIVYMPDTSRPEQEALEIMKGVDILIIDSTFNGANWMPHRHQTIDEAALLAAELEVGEVYLTHMAMHYDEPITLESLEERFEGTNIHPAFDGLTLTL